MMCLNKRRATLLATIAAFAIMFCVPPQAYAQNDGPCCAMLQSSRVTCKDTGCSGTITYMSCLEPVGPNSQHYRVTEVKCCTATYTNYTAPVGGNGCSDNASAPATALDTALYAEGVWVRTCAGKYVFTVRPS